jgi:hypothetical protein
MARRCGSNLAAVWRSSGNSRPDLAGCRLVPMRPAPQGAGNDVALSCIGRDGNQRTEVGLGHATAGNGPIPAEACRRSCRLCDCPSGRAFGTGAFHACCVRERAGSADLQRARNRSGRCAVSAGKRSLAVSVRCDLHDDGLQCAFRCAGDRSLGSRRGPPGGAIAMWQPGDPAADGPRTADPARPPDDLTPQSSRAV